MRLPPPPVLSGTVPPAEPPASLDDTSTPAAPAGPAVVSAVTMQPVDDGLTIHVAITGTAAYDWHRLPDQRWYVDLHNTTLTDAGRDERPQRRRRR